MPGDDLAATLSALREGQRGRSLDALKEARLLIEKYYLAGDRGAVGSLSEIIAAFAKAQPVDAPTSHWAEAKKRPSPDTVQTLVEKRMLHPECEWKAREILRIYMAACGFLGSKRGSFERVPRGVGGGNEVLMLRRHHAYLPWLAKMKEEGMDADFVFDIIIENRTLSEARARAKMGQRRALMELRKAFDLYGWVECG
jgi:hypothetical protein